MYGSATVMVLASQGVEGVNGFTLDPSTGEYVLTQQSLLTKDFHKIYSVNQGNWKYFNEQTKNYINSCLMPESGSPFSLRYVGSMIGDVHRTLIYGGIFMYPGDSRAPKGKLRLLYEVMPMAFIMHKVLFSFLSFFFFRSVDLFLSDGGLPPFYSECVFDFCSVFFGVFTDFLMTWVL